MRLASLIAALLAGLAAACGGGSPSTPDGRPDANVIPIDTPANVWTWVEIPGTKCANGTPAGFGVNRSTVGPDLFVFFQGGGACWDGPTCFVTKTSSHIEDTYTAATLAMEGYAGTVDHTPAANPLAQATYIYIPYCTGDLHAGAMQRDYDVNGQLRSVAHVGATNSQIFADTLRAAFPDARTVWLAGSSAGGYGATLNMHRFVDAYPGAAVHLLQDSSPFVPVLANYATWQSSWMLQYPPGCTDCTTSFPAVVDAVAAANPSSRIGLLHYDDDVVIRAYFGYAATAGALVPATDELLANQYDRPTTKAFVLAGAGHTMLSQIGAITGPNGVKLADWVLQWVTGDAAWATVR
ncbi:MAG: pectin acetylesterase-family hydrolase [Kofleriaceae bacterium]